MQQLGPQQESEVRKATGTVLGLSMWISKPWRLLLTKCGRDGAGRREIGGISSAGGLGLLFLFACFSPTGILWWVFFAALANQFWHRLRASREVHSFFVDESRLGGWFGGKARLVEGVVAVLLGAWVRETDSVASNWFLAAGVGHLLLMSFITQRQEAIDQDLRDSQLESTARAERLRAR